MPMTPDDFATAFEGTLGLAPTEFAAQWRDLQRTVHRIAAELDGEPQMTVDGKHVTGYEGGLRSDVRKVLHLAQDNAMNIGQVKRAVNGGTRKFTGAQIAGFITAVIASTTTIVVTIIQVAGT